MPLDPPPAPPDSALGLVPHPLRVAMTRRGFTELTEIQRAVLDPDLAGRCLRLSSQTGSGKTVALGMVIREPLLATPRPEGRDPVALIVTPTRELAMQVRDELRWLFEDLGIGVAAVTGGVDIVRERKTLARGTTVLVGTPGRLLDHLRGGSLRLDAIEHVVLDEADRMLDMGFRDELEALFEQLPAKRGTHLVSATFPPHVRELADALQHDPLHVQGTALGAANADIDHVAHLIAPDSVFPCLVNALLLQGDNRVLVFVQRRIDATETADALIRRGFAAQSLSGDLSQTQRTRALESFRSGQTRVLVCTDVAARGIDVSDIALVIHASLPEDGEAYVHRSGRTGRAGSRGTSLALVPGRGKRYMERLARQAKVQLDWRPPPSPAKVRKQLRKRARKALEASLVDASPAPDKLAAAERLLEDREPAVVVATLLEQLQPPMACEPMSVQDPAPSTGPRHHRPRRSWRNRGHRRR